MIGGYCYREKDSTIDARVRTLTSGFGSPDPFEHGYFFYTDPFQSDVKPYASYGESIALSEDLLVVRDESGPYRLARFDTVFLADFERQGPDAFNSIQSDFRMAIAGRKDSCRRLYLASNRAGSGRIYYSKLKGGIVFCSDLRFLLKLVPFEVSRKAIYALLKYGCIPEPLTIAENVSAIPAAHYLQYDADTGEEILAPYFRYSFPADRLQASFDEQQSLGRVKDILRGTAAFLGNYESALLLSGGIDSSLYGCYLKCGNPGEFNGFYCSFGREDPEYPYACAIGENLGVKLQVAVMEKPDAMRALDEVARLTDHPFSDFSSLPISFLLRFISERQGGKSLVIECNGGDDCFGFPALGFERKFRVKHSFPPFLKRLIARTLVETSYWKWESSEGFLARIASMADVHEKSYLNYFLVQAPVNYLRMEAQPDWDASLQESIERTASNCGQDYSSLGYEARTTIRQLLYVNSSRWAAKALSIGESLGMRVVYPYIWRDVLIEQGRIPWSAKIRGGVVKWPLKRLLEEYMPKDFIYRKKSGFVPPFVHWLTDPEFNEMVRGILSRPNACVTEIIPARILDDLLSDALRRKRLRSPILAMLWAAIFAESWIASHKTHTASIQPRASS